ncbi:alpha-ketoacid dehydrogenase subunit beta [Geobacter sulfurreducens]|jgi:pyruvate dehydrogenase E1 component beta subunit|uniref:Pyruvate dehydrogenase complex, E1 protein, beta subunit n=3 Tax=Geobacter TaxID=28231 RepID=Q74AE0_GEOSL|nr:MULTISPECIES: alpha-ketoacid dehydrogenase subunit beta [Geobacter]AAR35809.1 pyruvate dehydrogenase complex, E1 protein, beta subunit [Geobacter sulfurreducens PCA]ADI85197.1 pyruvate dehydrogenase complex, E1 protein, beta subunit [Geobacter sulfurreducens KN400]AJY68667.1 pyruvate dehydrogenase [Geobacter sulfurreducens]KIE41685.1 pyruvate dehydrogenase [Geobacter soli]MBE2887402.1 alpha-ketoacid dehydrogenase subunit beta [Geobacter anodireducens]
MPEMNYRDALNLALKEEMRRDPSVVVWGEDVALYEGSFKVTRGLLAEFGEERVKDTPISENSIVGVAVGAAMGGLRPVAELMTVNFALLAMDQIVNHMAKIRSMFGGQTYLPMVVRAPGGGGSQLGAQHSQSLETYFMHCPGIHVAVPATPADARGLLKAAIRDDNPVMFLEHELLYNSKGEVPDDPESVIPFGKADVKREGKDLTIVAYSRMTILALQAAEELAKEGISCEVVDLRTLTPLDTATFTASVKKTGRAVVVEECWRSAGLGGHLAAIIAEECFDRLLAPVRRVSGLDVPMPYSRKIEKLCIPQPETIAAAVRETLSGTY